MKQMRTHRLPQMKMRRTGPAPQPRRAAKQRAAPAQETLAEKQARLQRAVDHGWRPRDPLLPGITLRIPE